MRKEETKNVMSLLALKNTLDELAEDNLVKWYGHVLKRDSNDVLRVLEFEVARKRRHG